MQTVTPPDNASKSSEPELHLLPEGYLEADWRLWRMAAVGSVAFHIVAVLVLHRVDLSPPPRQESEAFVRHVTPLYIPRDLTQKAPNKQPVSKELTIASIAPRLAPKVPSPAPAAKTGQAAKSIPLPPPQAPPKVTIIEAPKVEAPKVEAVVPNIQAAQLPKTAPLPPAPASVPPKLAFEEVTRGQPNPGAGKPTGLITMPNTSISEAVRNVARSGAQMGLSVGDADLGGSGPGLNLPPSAGRPQSSLQLASDPMGVDFRAYIIQVLAAVRRNWFAVYPEAARLGQRGQVVLKFGISKAGLVTTINFSSQSGAKALDQSAVASISASNPLPPLPPEFKGDHIVLQMTFSYNLPR